MPAHLKRELGLCVVPICNNLEPIVIDSPSPTRGYLGNTTHPDQIWFDMKKNTTTVFKVSENVDIDIDIVSCNPLIFLWNNLEFYMCGANFYCCSCVLAFFLFSCLDAILWLYLICYVWISCHCCPLTHSPLTLFATYHGPTPCRRAIASIRAIVSFCLNLSKGWSVMRLISNGVNQSHITCKLDPNKWISPLL